MPGGGFGMSALKKLSLVVIFFLFFLPFKIIKIKNKAETDKKSSRILSVRCEVRDLFDKLISSDNDTDEIYEAYKKGTPILNAIPLSMIISDFQMNLKTKNPSEDTITFVVRPLVFKFNEEDSSWSLVMANELEGKKVIGWFTYYGTGVDTSVAASGNLWQKGGLTPDSMINDSTVYYYFTGELAKNIHPEVGILAVDTIGYGDDPYLVFKIPKHWLVNVKERYPKIDPVKVIMKKPTIFGNVIGGSVNTVRIYLPAGYEHVGLKNLDIYDVSGRKVSGGGERRVLNPGVYIVKTDLDRDGLRDDYLGKLIVVEKVAPSFRIIREKDGMKILRKEYNKYREEIKVNEEDWNICVISMRKPPGPIQDTLLLFPFPAWSMNFAVLNENNDIDTTYLAFTTGPLFLGGYPVEPSRIDSFWFFQNGEWRWGDEDTIYAYVRWTNYPVDVNWYLTMIHGLFICPKKTMTDTWNIVIFPSYAKRVYGVFGMPDTITHVGVSVDTLPYFPLAEASGILLSDSLFMGVGRGRYWLRRPGGKRDFLLDWGDFGMLNVPEGMLLEGRGHNLIWTPWPRGPPGATWAYSKEYQDTIWFYLEGFNSTDSLAFAQATSAYLFPGIASFLDTERTWQYMTKKYFNAVWKDISPQVSSIFPELAEDVNSYKQFGIPYELTDFANWDTNLRVVKWKRSYWVEDSNSHPIVDTIKEYFVTRPGEWYRIVWAIPPPYPSHPVQFGGFAQLGIFDPAYGFYKIRTGMFAGDQGIDATRLDQGVWGRIFNFLIRNEPDKSPLPPFAYYPIWPKYITDGILSKVLQKLYSKK